MSYVSKRFRCRRRPVHRVKAITIKVPTAMDIVAMLRRFEERNGPGWRTDAS